jgi:L-fuconolactonase
MDVIDSHHHFWIYTPEEYGWISDEMQALRRDFLPRDLQGTIRDSNVVGVVSVQARQSVAESDFLLGIAAVEPWVRGVVGWAPLADPKAGTVLERLAANRKLKGIRHVVQDEPDPDFILRSDFNEGVKLLDRFGLAYDILIYERHLANAIQFVDRHPKQRFILDHVAKPRIREGILEPWNANLREMAKRENVYCKLSGVVTEAACDNWSPADLAPYVEVVIEAFGPKRVMFGSDWPVLLICCPYPVWMETVLGFVSSLSDSEQSRIWAETAIEAYRLS